MVEGLTVVGAAAAVVVSCKRRQRVGVTGVIPMRHHVGKNFHWQMLMMKNAEKVVTSMNW